MNRRIQEESVLGQRICTARKTNGYVSGIVEGMKGIGKSSYCIQVSFQVYKKIFNLNDEKTYELVLNNTLFTIRDVIRVLKKATSTNTVIPCLIWDDVLVHASSMAYFLQMKEVSELRSVVETIRTGASSMLLNCTDRSGLLNFLRRGDDTLVNIVHGESNGYSRIARGYHIFRLPSGKSMVYKSFEDDFSCYLPNYVFQTYQEKRKLYLSEAVERMEKLADDTEITHRYNEFEKRLKRMGIDSRIEKLKKKGVEIDG